MMGPRRAALGLLAAAVIASAGVVVAVFLTRDRNVVVGDAAFPSAMTALPGGGFLYAERATGNVREVDPRGRLLARLIAHVDVSTKGQRGILGLAVDERGRVFACWTDSDGTILVGQVAPGRTRIVWRGPQSADLANGGRIAFAPTGSFVIGIGGLLDPTGVQDPTTPNGKILALDPDGPPSQTPRVISAGWHNPFAFAFTPGGELWVADNAPKEDPERLARGDVGGVPSDVTELPPHTVPTGLVALSNDELVMCGYGTHVLEVYRIGPDGLARPQEPLADDCSLGVIQTADGRLIYANEDSIRDHEA